MTGCPHGLIYSASQTFDRLRKRNAVTYQSNTLVTAVGEESDGCFLRVRSVTSGVSETVRADRVFVACGGIGSTRLVLGSLADRPDHLTMSESVRFAFKRDDTDADKASIDAVVAAFAKGSSVKDLMVALAGSRSFRYRIPGTGEMLR